MREGECVTFLDALRSRYEKGAVGAEGCRELAGRAGLSERDKEKQTNLELLERVVLQDANVAGGGEAGAIATACPKIEELDLTGNPLAGWDATLGIARELPALRFFSLVRVALPPPPPAAIEGVGAALGALRTLVLNETGLSWAHACTICAQLPRLEELQLSDHTIDLDAEAELQATRALPDVFPALRVLLLENAGVRSWDDVWRLRDLPALEVLSLNANPIDRVRYVRADEAAGGANGAAAPFATLQRLFLYESQLSSWEDVDQCDQFPALRELRLQDAPVVKGIGASVARQLIIARVGGIDALNGATVSRREREAAERFYLRQSIQHYPEPLPTPPAAEGEGGAAAEPQEPRLPEELGAVWAPFLKSNPRWRGLVGVHGMHSAQLPRTGGGGRTLAMSLVTLTLTSKAGESVDAKHTERKLPTSLTVAKLKLVCCQVFKLDPAKQRLFYGGPDAAGGAADGSGAFMDELDDDMRPLAFYGVADGGKIVMDEWAPTDAH